MRVVTQGDVVIESQPGIGVSVSKEFSWLDTASDQYVHYPYTLGSGAFADLPLAGISEINFIYIEGSVAFQLTVSGTEIGNGDVGYVGDIGGAFQTKYFMLGNTSLTKISVRDISGVETALEVIMAGS